MAQEQELSESKLEEYKEIFQIFDKNGDGSIDPVELGGALQALGQNPTKQDIQEMIEEADSATNPNGKVEFNEFCTMMEKRRKEPAQEEEELVEAFKMFDKDNNGYIDREELRKVLTGLGQDKMTEEEVDDMIKSADTDGDDKISYKEFVAKMMC